VVSGSSGAEEHDLPCSLPLESWRSCPSAPVADPLVPATVVSGSSGAEEHDLPCSLPLEGWNANWEAAAGRLEALNANWDARSLTL